MKRSRISVKIEAGEDYNEFKEDIKSIVENSYSDNDNMEEDDNNEVKFEEKSNKPRTEKAKLETVLSKLKNGQEKLEVISCNLCEKTFTRGKDYRKHKYSVHEQDEENIWEEWEQIKADRGKRQDDTDEFKPYSEQTKGTNVCKYCGKEIKNGYAMMKVHYALKHREELIQNHPEIQLDTPCLECELMFLGNADLKRHLHEEHGKLWNCETCGQDFPTKGERLVHRQTEHADELEARGIPTGKKDQECPYCHKMYEKQLGHSRFRQTLDKHIFNVHKNKLYLHPHITAMTTCDECDTEFYDKNDCRKHKRIAHGETATCEVCSKVTRNQAALYLHMKVHANEVHICDICSLEFRCLAYLKNHYSRVHETKGEALFPCKLCSYRKAQTEETLQKHMLEIHSGVKYLCSHCPQSFKTVRTRKVHEKIVHGEKTEKCDECEKMFSTKGTLKEHIRQVHIKAKDKICPHCGEAFFLRESFKIHVLRHTDDRQFPCDVCGKAFLTNRDFKKHMDTHTTPYMCDQCDKSFGSRFLLNDHVKMKHDGIKHECRFKCGWDAWFRRQCLNHEKTCRLNPVPGAPYSVAVGTASSLTLERYHEKLKESPFKHNE